VWLENVGVWGGVGGRVGLDFGFVSCVFLS